MQGISTRERTHSTGGGAPKGTAGAPRNLALVTTSSGVGVRKVGRRCPSCGVKATAKGRAWLEGFGGGRRRHGGGEAPYGPALAQETGPETVNDIKV